MKSRIVRNNHIHLLEINSELHPLYGYMSYQPEKAKYEDFRAAGVKLFFAPVYAGDRGINQQSGIRPFMDGFWKGYEQYDFTPVEKVFRRVLGGCKVGEVYLIPRLMVEPPIWWEAENPTELCRDAAGMPVHHSYCSEKWFEDTRRMMEAFRDWIEKSGWSEYVAGWHIACGNTEEFLRPKLYSFQYTDYSECARKEFVQWLKGQYDLEQLNEAWNTRYAHWNDVRMASPAQRMFASKGVLRDPDIERQTIDTYRFINEANANAVVRLCKIAKEVTDYQIVIGAFFGYFYCDADIGHVAADIVYRSDVVDFLASPFTYTHNRKAGIDLAFPSCLDSSMLHEKPWFMEADIRTCLSRPISECMPFADPPVNRAYDAPIWLGEPTVEMSLHQMKKAFARVLTHNTAMWWFDMWGGWHDHEDFMCFHRQAAEMYREHALSGGCTCTAPIAVFMDDSIMYESAPTSPLGDWAKHELNVQLGWAGTPHHCYSLSDFERVNPEQYRLCIFVTPCRWTKETLASLEKWKCDGRILAFLGCVDSGIASGVEQIREDALEELPAVAGQKAALKVPTMRYLPERGDIVMSTAADGRATALLRRTADYSVYVDTAISLPAARIRLLTCAAAGHVYNLSGDVVYASDKYIAIHAASDGIKRILYPYKAKLEDVFTGEILPGNETFVDVEMKLGETRMLRIHRK